MNAMLEAVRTNEERRRFNTSGIEALDTKCIVLPDPVQEKIGSIILSDEAKEKLAWRRQKCTLVSIGGSAFAEWVDAPRVGDRVFVSQYAGSKIKTDAGDVFWIINDKDIIGRIEE